MLKSFPVTLVPHTSDRPTRGSGAHSMPDFSSGRANRHSTSHKHFLICTRKPLGDLKHQEKKKKHFKGVIYFRYLIQ